MSTGESAPRRHVGFPTTQWSAISRAASEQMPSGRPALDSLLQRYLPALKAHLCGGRGMSEDAASDILQSFVAEKVLQQQLLARADRSRGRFRTFLLNVLDRFAIDQRRRQSAQARRVSATNLDLSQCADPSDSAAIPSREYDLCWAREVLGQAVARTRGELESAGRAELWAALEFRVIAPIVEGRDPPSYEELVVQFGFSSPTEACSAVLTGRRTLARMLRRLIAEYADEGEIEEELADLKRILSRQ